VAIRAIFAVVVYEHVVYTVKIVLEAVIADVSPNTERIQKYHDSVTARVMRYDDLRPGRDTQASLRKSAVRTSAVSRGASIDFVSLVESHEDFFEIVSKACHRHRWGDKHSLMVPENPPKSPDRNMFNALGSGLANVGNACGSGLAKVGNVVGNKMGDGMQVVRSSLSGSTSPVSASATPEPRTKSYKDAIHQVDKVSEV
jgi:hypothetical protein